MAYQCAICGIQFQNGGVIDHDTQKLVCGNCARWLHRCMTCKCVTTLKANEACPKGINPFEDIVNQAGQIQERRVKIEPMEEPCDFYEMRVIE